jgi:hypothetical protein
MRACRSSQQDGPDHTGGWQPCQWLRGMPSHGARPSHRLTVRMRLHSWVPACSRVARHSLLPQLMGMFFLPLLVAYIMESRAKRVFLARLAPEDPAHPWHSANRGRLQEWALYVLLLAASVAVCDVLVDNVHRLKGLPVTPHP